MHLKYNHYTEYLEIKESISVLFTWYIYLLDAHYRLLVFHIWLLMVNPSFGVEQLS